ncbi:MAG: GspH/FimT family pseudopilin [Pseudomonadota bacterium]|nr:GspH/FimT family pseudopilin [Pseudomonadota bacterium]
MRAAGGFTLIELLVVLVLMGIVLTFATLGSGLAGSERRLDLLGERLGGCFERAGERAVARAQVLGLALDDGVLDWRYRDRGGGWQPLPSGCSVRRLPAWVRVDWRVEGRRLRPGAIRQGRPVLVWLPDGAAADFVLNLAAPEGAALVIEGDVLGRVELRRDG